MSGTRMTQIAYKGSPQILAALIGGEINMYMVASISGVMPQLKSGRVRALGVSTQATFTGIAERAADRRRFTRL
jgi:tripartite-type tricarboxylate transporter receptor subunit TctC